MAAGQDEKSEDSGSNKSSSEKPRQPSPEERRKAMRKRKTTWFTMQIQPPISIENEKSSYFGVSYSDLEMFKNPYLPSNFIKEMVVLKSDGSVGVKEYSYDDILTKLQSGAPSQPNTDPRPGRRRTTKGPSHVLSPHSQSFTGVFAPNEVDHTEK